ncbi:hypothetical protein EDC04DRAFT_1003660 [Pisolithus marmoratus]|nr:hypothetical protein EDC04DRAFT_1003660 [Pisolithus marmoratus]
MQMRTRVLKLCCLCCAGVGKTFVQNMMSHVGSLMERKKSHTFWNAYRDHDSHTGATRHASNIDYARQLNAPSMFQEIEALQAKLNKTEDEDEQRALEEDITGKILWLCRCGIYAEVLELLPKVVDYIRGEENMEQGVRNMCSAMIPILFADPGLDDQAHLQRIMLDAGAKISKCELLRAARDATQAKWSSTNRGRPAMNNQGTTPGVSSQTPPTSVV